MSSRTDTDGTVDTLTLTGDLTISRAAEILSLLKRHLETCDNVRVILQDVSRVDLTCLQLLCSAQRTASETSKTLSFEAPIPTVLRQLIQQTGFKRNKRCAGVPEQNCLCFDGGK